MVCVHVAYDLAQRAESALQLHHLRAQHRVLSFCCRVVLGGDVQCCHELLFPCPQLVDLFFFNRRQLHSDINAVYWQNKKIVGGRYIYDRQIGRFYFTFRGLRLIESFLIFMKSVSQGTAVSFLPGVYLLILVNNKFNLRSEIQYRVQLTLLLI